MTSKCHKWTILPVGDERVCLDMQPGFACGKKDVENGVPHLRMNNISSEGVADFSLIRRVPRDVANKKNRWLESGDILFCNTNSTDLVGKTCLFEGWNEPCTYSNHLTRLRANTETVTPEWLSLSLRHLWLSRHFAVHCTEFIGQSAFNKDKLQKVEIRIPPLSEQIQIVSKIKAVSHAVEETRQLYEEAAAELSVVVPALLAKAFQGEL